MKKNQIAGWLVISCGLLVCCKASLQNSPEPSQLSQKESSEYIWKELTNEAAFPKSYNFQLFATPDTAWAFHPGGNWYSLDGKTWIKS